MNNFQKNPLKLFIQDIFRANETDTKYIYEIFGLTFKNIMIHGVITSVYNTRESATNLEISDPTGTVQVYYDSTKNNKSISKNNMRDLKNGYVDASKFGDPNIGIISKMMDRINKNNVMIFEEGSFISVIGDIFVDSLKNCRMVSAFECSITSVEYDIVWMEELRYLYDKFYVRNSNELLAEVNNN